MNQSIKYSMLFWFQGISHEGPFAHHGPGLGGPSFNAHLTECATCRQFFLEEDIPLAPPTFIWGGIIIGRDEEEEEGFVDEDEEEEENWRKKKEEKNDKEIGRIK